MVTVLRLRSLPTDGHRDPDRSVRTFPPAIVGGADEPGVTAEASLLAKPVNLCRSGPGGWCESFCHRTVAHQRHDVPWGGLPQVWRVRVGFVVVVSLGECGGVGSSSSVVVRVKNHRHHPHSLGTRVLVTESRVDQCRDVSQGDLPQVWVRVGLVCRGAGHPTGPGLHGVSWRFLVPRADSAIQDETSWRFGRNGGT